MQRDYNILAYIDIFEEAKEDKDEKYNAANKQTNK